MLCRLDLYEGVDAKEDANVAVFALMECIQGLITEKTDTRDESMQRFQSMVDLFIRAWQPEEGDQPL